MRTQWDALRDAVHGAVITPGDTRFADARRPWNRRVEQRPAAVVVAADAEDVITTVRYAAEHDVQVAPQAVGHGAGDALDGALLLRTGALRELAVDPGRRTARVGAGVLWRELHECAAPHQLAGLAGTSPDLSVTGYTLGGGVGLFARRHGLAANTVTAAEVVTADGRLLMVDRDREPDLFWALRGGGGGCGIVTALQLNLIHVPDIVGGQLIWPVEHAHDLLGTYTSWVDSVPDELTSIVTVLQVPPLPSVPEPLRGATVIALTVCHLGVEAETRALLRPFTDLAEPLVDTLGARTPAQLDFHGDPPTPLPVRMRTELLTELPAASIDTLLELGPGGDSPLTVLDIRHLGGALAQPGPGHGAAGAIDAPYLLEGLGLAPTPESRVAIDDRLAQLGAATAPYSTGSSVLSLTTTDDAYPGRCFPAAHTLERLAAIKHRWDPQQLIRDPLTRARAPGPVGSSR